jgi:hypothetical protein
MINKWQAIIVAIVLAAAAGFIIFLIAGTNKNPEYSVTDGTLTISSQFGTSVKLNTISNLSLTPDAPEIKTRTNGASIGGKHRGDYVLSSGEKAKLYIDEAAPQFIRFSSDGTVYYLSADSEDATRALYEQLQNATT